MASKILLNIYMGTEEKNSPKLRLPTFLFAFFLGMFGAHRFYVGKVGTGVFQLILTLTLIGTIASSVWVFIDWVIILSGAFRDADGLKIVKWTN